MIKLKDVILITVMFVSGCAVGCTSIAITGDSNTIVNKKEIIDNTKGVDINTEESGGVI